MKPKIDESAVPKAFLDPPLWDYILIGLNFIGGAAARMVGVWVFYLFLAHSIFSHAVEIGTIPSYLDGLQTFQTWIAIELFQELLREK